MAEADNTVAGASQTPEHEQRADARSPDPVQAPAETSREEHISQAAKAYTPAQAEEPSHHAYLPDAYFNEPLFQADNTGTRKYKSLLRGLKNIITKEYDPSDNPDIMPSQLAKFYEELNGDYNQLFLKSPSQSLSFIYKSLGCSYSLQPVPGAQRVEEPEVPGLKTEGWIMWSTIQMLLGPDEHAGFLMDAVKRWDVVDPETGKIFPKTIPREAFPIKADSKMVDWYEGVSDRLKKEADEEAEERERQRAMAQHAEHRRIMGRREDEEDSVDSRGPALAYFRNPLYRHVDGRPSIVRLGPPIVARPQKRPQLSPRQSIVDRGKEAATTVGAVIRNVASPHLWDGGSNSSRERKRRSASGGRHHFPGEEPPQGSPYDDRLPVPHSGVRHQRHKSRNSDRIGSSPDDSWDSDQRSPTSNSRPQSRRQDDREHGLRHSRSHDPTPSQRDYDDYFQGAESPKQRRGSAFDASAAGIGPSFAPSSDLPMAARVAQYAPRRPPGRDDGRPQSRNNERYDEPNGPRSRSRPRHDERRYDDRPTSRPRYDDRALEHRQRRNERPLDDHHARHSHSHDMRERRGERERFNDRPDERRYDERRDYDRERLDDRRGGYDSPDRRRLSDAGSRRSASGRRSNASDLDSGYSGPEDRERRSNRKQTRFAPTPISGVDGRRYVDQSPWQE